MLTATQIQNNGSFGSYSSKCLLCSIFQDPRLEFLTRSYLQNELLLIFNAQHHEMMTVDEDFIDSLRDFLDVNDVNIDKFIVCRPSGDGVYEIAQYYYSGLMNEHTPEDDIEFSLEEALVIVNTGAHFELLVDCQLLGDIEEQELEHKEDDFERAIQLSIQAEQERKDEEYARRLQQEQQEQEQEEQRDERRVGVSNGLPMMRNMDVVNYQPPQESRVQRNIRESREEARRRLFALLQG